MLSDKLSGVRVKGSRSTPLWKGPEEDGITFSLLSRFLSCPERFRLLVVQGLTVPDHFNHRLEFGTMWHLCEEAHAADRPWQQPLIDYCRGLALKYPTARDDVEHWLGLASALFPVYVNYWSTHDDVKQRTPILQEQTFRVRRLLPSGRTVTLRGKWDSVDLIGKGGEAGIYLQENKTKSQIDRRKLERQLTFDLQTMTYLTALTDDQDASFWRRANKRWRNLPVLGVRYNVIRRSAHRQGKKESRNDFLDRVASLAVEDPGDWFARWRVEVSRQDLKKFQKHTLDPLLERLCLWWDYVSSCAEAKADVFEAGGKGLHWQYPFGVYNPLEQGGESEFDEYLTSGSERTLRRTDDLFPELGEDK